MNIHPSLRFKAGMIFLALVGGSALASAASANDSGLYRGSRSAHSSRALTPVPRSSVDKALAKDGGSAYRVGESRCVLPSRHTLQACFDKYGAHFASAGVPLTLRLLGYGRDGEFFAIEAVKPTIAGNNVSYDYGTLNAWWRVLPLGFEQGFTFADRPPGHGKLTLKLAIGNTSGEDNGTLTWGRLRYGDLVVSDEKGRIVPATLKHQGDRIVIAVNDTHAVYPLTVDPLLWLEQKVSASDGAARNEFGWSVAISGTTALVGAPDATVQGDDERGAVYVFGESDGSWTQTAKLVANDGAQLDGFGDSVALDGTRALIGANFAAVNKNPYQGAAYVFDESNGIWTQATKLVASDGESGDLFGGSVALSGSTALVGASSATVNGWHFQGAAYVFRKSNGTWTQTAKLTENDGGFGDTFGCSVAVSGSTALVGALYASINGEGDGAAYVFDESNGAWNLTQTLTPSDGAWGDAFGIAVALDDRTALVGDRIFEIGGPHPGAVYVFGKSGGSWTQTAKLTAGDGGQGNDFGLYVALAPGGSTALVGAPAATINGRSYQGAAYLFDESGGIWTQTAKLTASDGESSEEFGSAVALDGQFGLVGAPFAVVGGAQRGAAYFYDRSNLDLAVSAPRTVNRGQQYLSQTIVTNSSSVGSPAVTADIRVPAAASFVSAVATQGDCSDQSGVVQCKFGSIEGNAGSAAANVTLKAIGSVGTTIENRARVIKAMPPLTARAASAITYGDACPEGYAEYDGSLIPGAVARSPVYRAPRGEENAILTAPEGFELYVMYQSGRFGRDLYLVPDNELHRWGPKGSYRWLVRAGDAGGAYTLCLRHP